ncbi:MAG TPA: methionine--tRNA ligase subunit beta [Edaphobacter sp.]|jgi:methionyl-tRNA synthetase|nr:methionine--tRNA ligase subunit beta [Edaphobacter sp.]
MSTPKKFYLTTPIYYVNARPHIGHAYTTIAADVIARRHRLLGDDTFLLTGTDEHGQKVERSAAAAGVSPQEFTDQVSATFKALWDRMGITYDDYVRTTEPRHTKAVQRLFQDLCDRDAIYLSTYTGQYSVGEEMFVDGPPGTIGPDGKPTETVTEENYFFRLSNYQEKLIDLIESGELEIQPEVRRNEVLSFLRGNPKEATENGEIVAIATSGNPYVPGALKDFSLSRTSVSWGVQVPSDPKHTIYVWFDALINYMSAIGYSSDNPELQKKFEHLWPADLHLVGKEIIRFHCVYWPAVLLAADLPLPKAITAHGWLLFEESKMSKSRGNIVRAETILDAFGTLKPKPVDGPGPELSDEYWKHEQDLFASDVLRYFLLREIPFGQDGSFSFDALVQRYNSDLANGYGNLVSRTLSMIQKYFDGYVNPSGRLVSKFFYEPAVDLIQHCSINSTAANLTRYLTGISGVIALVDKYITDKAPWKVAADRDEDAQLDLEEILYTVAESIRIITALLHPILPFATGKVWEQLGLGDIDAAIKHGELANLQWGGLQKGVRLGDVVPIFPRAPKELIQLMNDMEQKNNVAKPEPSKLVDEKIAPSAVVPEDPTHPGAPPRTSSLAVENPGAHVGASAAATPELAKPPASHAEAPASQVFATAAAASNVPDTPRIAIDDFVKVDLRVAKIVVAERIPKADKLLRLEVDLGYETRQILSGIAEWYTPEELIGRRIVVIANLAPRKMRGLESHGMLLAASEGENGKPVLATFGEDIALGSRLK